MTLFVLCSLFGLAPNFRDSGTFTWMPAVVQGMYHPQYSGRTEVREIAIK
jgi:hypothetical protein